MREEGDMSSYVVVAPEFLAEASGNLTGIQSTLQAANASVAGSTTQVLVAAGDEVSAAIATMFGTFGQEYQALSAQTALFHDQFVQALTAGAGAYGTAEAANVSPLQTFEDD